MKKILGIALATAMVLGCTTPMTAKKKKSAPFDLSGYTLIDGGTVDRAFGEGFQGFAIYENYMVSLCNGGHASLYRLDADGAYQLLNNFDLGSVSKFNHANVADFGVERYAKGDAMPVLYVSQCKNDKERRLRDACFVERISADGKSELVQTIVLDNHNKYYGGAVQWLIDKKRKRLVGFGNTINNTDPQNRFRIMICRLPKIKEGEKVVLTEADIYDTYLIQDYDPTYPHVQIGQGGTIVGDCIIMPTGFGTELRPSVIYSWNIYARKMVSAINMQEEVPFEFEDCDFYRGGLYIQCNHGKRGHFKIMQWQK